MKFTEMTVAAFAMKRNMIDNAIRAGILRENLIVTVWTKCVRVVKFSHVAVCPTPAQSKKKSVV